MGGSACPPSPPPPPQLLRPCVNNTSLISHAPTHQLQMQKMQIILLPLSGHAHLAEPGCLCTKQALGAVQANSWRTGQLCPKFDLCSHISILYLEVHWVRGYNIGCQILGGSACPPSPPPPPPQLLRPCVNNTSLISHAPTHQLHIATLTSFMSSSKIYASHLTRVPHPLVTHSNTHQFHELLKDVDMPPISHVCPAP